MDASYSIEEDHPLYYRVAVGLWNRWKGPAADMFQNACSTYMGQVTLKFADKFLWLAEKSSQWSLPPPPTPANHKHTASIELTRPLPWIFFIPVLFMLRFIREGLSIGCLIMGKEPIRPSNIVRFIQNCRRSLRVIKYEGMRNMRMKIVDKPEEEHVMSLRSWIYWFIIKMQSMMCYNPVKYEHTHKASILRKDPREEIKVMRRRSDSSRRSESRSEVSEHDQSMESDQNQSNENNETIDTKVWKKLLTDIENFIGSDSDDSDYSLANESDLSEDETELESNIDDDEPNISETKDNNDVVIDENNTETNAQITVVIGDNNTETKAQTSNTSSKDGETTNEIPSVTKINDTEHKDTENTVAKKPETDTLLTNGKESSDETSKQNGEQSQIQQTTDNTIKTSTNTNIPIPINTPNGTDLLINSTIPNKDVVETLPSIKIPTPTNITSNESLLPTESNAKNENGKKEVDPTITRLPNRTDNLSDTTPTVDPQESVKI